jgi:mannosyltransferase OCH1-like enzyme
MAIPKIIHQTDKTKDIPEKHKAFQQKLIELHPDWDYRYYDDEECRNFVIQNFPYFIPIYDSYSSNIQRVDLFRIIAVYKMGGFYVDLDIECFNKIDDLCEYNCVFGEEKRLTKEEIIQFGHKDSVRVANYMFGSRPNHPFLLHILEAMTLASRRNIKTENDVLESTGPGLITTVYFNFKDRYPDVVLLPNKDRVCANPFCRDISCHFGNYARHFHDGSWRWERNWGDVKNSPQEEKKPTQKQINILIKEIDSSIKKIGNPDRIFILKTYNDISHNGLSSVFYRLSKIGSVVDDTKHLDNRKVLVGGTPNLYLENLSSQNINVVYTAFESTRLPDFWTKGINNYYNYCIVPHDYIKKVFLDSGVEIPIEIIHPGFARYKRMRRNMNIEKAFRIGFLGIPLKRKNLNKLFKACRNLLRKVPGLKLAIHVSKHHNWLYKADVDALKSASFVEWSEGYLSEDEMTKWYSRLSCLVFPSGGEGWSFTPRESLYLGVPTIISDIPIHSELVESGYYKVIPIKGLEDAEFEESVSGQWHTVETGAIENSILDVYQHYGHVQIQALKGSKWIENKWSNESTQQRILSFLTSI